jgi:hypothetical protein
MWIPVLSQSKRAEGIMKKTTLEGTSKKKHTSVKWHWHMTIAG